MALAERKLLGVVEWKKVKSMSWRKSGAQGGKEVIHGSARGVSEKGRPDAPISLRRLFDRPIPRAARCGWWSEHGGRDLISPTISDIGPEKDLVGKAAAIDSQNSCGA